MGAMTQIVHWVIVSVKKIVADHFVVTIPQDIVRQIRMGIIDTAINHSNDHIAASRHQIPGSYRGNIGSRL